MKYVLKKIGSFLFNGIVLSGMFGAIYTGLTEDSIWQLILGSCVLAIYWEELLDSIKGGDE